MGWDSIVGLIGQGVSAINTGAQNRQTRKFNEHMYDREMSDKWSMWNAQNLYDTEKWNKENAYMEGLWNKQNAYNEEVWNKMNEYNSPRAQMARFGEAGLNPNLAYGQMSSGPGLDAATLDPIKQDGSPIGGPPSHMSWNPKPINLDLLTPLAQSAQIANTKAQTNNLEELNRNIQIDGDIKIAEAAGKAAENAHNVKAYAQEESLYGQQADALRLANKRRAQEIDLANKQEGRNAEIHVNSMEQMRKTIEILGVDIDSKKIEQQLNILKSLLIKKDLDWQDVNPVRVIPLMLKTPINETKDALNFLFGDGSGKPAYAK